MRARLVENIELIPPEPQKSLEDEFGLNTRNAGCNYIIGDDLFFDIVDNNLEEKIGFLVLSKDEYSELEIESESELNGKVIFLSFIRLFNPGKGNLREIINKLCEYLKNDYDYIVLQVDPHEKQNFEILYNKYKKVGFIGYTPNLFWDYDYGVSSDINLEEYDIFMYKKIN